MLTSSFDSHISLLEAQFREISAALSDSESLAMVLSSSTALQQLTVELVQMADAIGRDQLRSPNHLRRMSALASGMVALRENLARHSAYVERALEVLVPASRQKSTYADSGMYAASIRQSGKFTAFSV